MKIAVTNNVFPIGRHMAYGGERIVFYLIEELAKRHDVYVFAREGSDFTGVPIKDYIPVGPLRSEVDVHYEAAKAYTDKHNIDFDVYQVNYFGPGYNEDCWHLAPAVAELTWCRWAHCAPFWPEPLMRIVPPRNIVSYSKVLQQDFFNSPPGVPITMIHYGIPKCLYSLEKGHDGYAVWIGKVEGGKAPHLAIKLALAAGLKIVLMGPPYNTGTFWQQIGPYLDHPDVYWVRGVDDEQKCKIMSRAKVFISSNDNTWKEHFGIVNIEALAMGVPVLGFNRLGQECAIAVDGIIEHGKSGFFLNYSDSNDEQYILDQGVPLIQAVDQIDRRECRLQYLKKFTSDLMARRYEWFYQHIMDNGPVANVEVPF